MEKQNKDPKNNNAKHILWIIITFILVGTYAYNKHLEKELKVTYEKLTANKSEDESTFDFIMNLNSNTQKNTHKAAQHNQNGIKKYAQEDYASALEEFNQAIELLQSEPMLYNNRGNTKMQLLDIQSAISDFSKAIELDKSFGEAYLNRGTAYSILGEHEKACIDVKKAQRLGYSFDDDFLSFEAILDVMDCEE